MNHTAGQMLQMRPPTEREAVDAYRNLMMDLEPLTKMRVEILGLFPRKMFLNTVTNEVTHAEPELPEWALLQMGVLDQMAGRLIKKYRDRFFGING